MDGSILADVRVACNLNRNDTSFDEQLIIHTNTFLFTSAQLGVGKKGFFINGDEEVWTDFVSEDFEYFAALKTYIGLRVMLIFDPPENSGVLAAYERTVKELEWRIYDEADIKDEIDK